MVEVVCWVRKIDIYSLNKGRFNDCVLKKSLAVVKNTLTNT